MAITRRGVEWEKAGPTTKDREELLFTQGQKRGVRRFLRVVISLAMPIFILFRSLFGPTESHPEAAVFVALVLCYVFLGVKEKKTAWQSWIDWILFFISAAIGIYVVWASIEIGSYSEFFTVQLFGNDVVVDVVAGTVLLLLVLEANRRTMGWALVIFVAIFVIYIPLRPYLPGFLRGAPIPWSAYILQMFSRNAGIYGQGTEVLISLVFLFLMFGAVMVESRVGAFFTSLANSLVGGQTGGSGKVTVVASGFLGSINASGLSSVVTTGPITIPMMKAAGFKPTDAAAIEVVASTGASWTPPVMGSAAYLMAEILGIPYGNLCLYVIPAAVMYYVAVFLGVHCKAKKEGIVGLPKDQLPSTKKVIMEGGYLVLPIILMITLLALGYSVSRVGFMAIAGVILLSFVRKETRMDPLRILSAIAQATRATVIVSTTLIVIGVVIAVVDVTGIGLTLSLLMRQMSRDNLILGLIISAIVAFILGLPLPPLIVYLYGVAFMVPALINMGANPIAAHMFFYFWGVLGTITPPVCVTAFAAATIAEAPLMKTGWVTSKLAYVAYLLPFLFVFDPTLLLQNVTWGDVPPLLIAFGGILIFTTGAEGYLFGIRSAPERALLLIIGISMIFGVLWHSLGFIGLGVLVIIAAFWYYRQRGKRELTA